MSHRPFDSDSVARHIVAWLQDYLNTSGMNGWIVGVSGGIDSAVTSTLCAMSGAPTTCVEMPIHQAPDQVSRASSHILDLCQKHPRVRRSTVSLTEVYDVFSRSLPDGPDESGGLAMANSRARLRMTTLYALGQRSRLLVAGTGNKVEDFGVGFYTKYGDGGVDVSPIADLTKSEVFSLPLIWVSSRRFSKRHPQMVCGATTARMKISSVRVIPNWSGPWNGKPLTPMIPLPRAQKRKRHWIGVSRKSWPRIAATTGPIATK